MEGRGEEKAFLYEIVSNKKNGVDTDKMDYLQRDIFSCKGKKANLEIIRLLNCAGVDEDQHNPNRSQIYYKEKAITDLQELFRTREINHRQM